MNPYYLIAQLPSLDGLGENMPVPMTEEQFSELCRRHLSKRACAAFETLTLSPEREPQKTGFALIDAWNEGERALRLALGQARAERMGKRFPIEEATAVSSALAQLARETVGLRDPWEAERRLNRHRLAFLETLRPADAFAEDTVFYYGLKLKLILHIRQFDATAGEAAYRTIYRAVLDGERSEVVS